MAIVILLILCCLFPFIMRGFFALIGICVVALVIGAMISASHAQQQTRTTCYWAGATQVCETTSMGAVISTSRCYQAGREMRCETTGSSSSSSSSTTVLPVPNLNIPRR